MQDLQRVASVCFLQVVQLNWSEPFVAAHDENVWNCTQELLDIEGTARVRQLLSLRLAFGGLGLRSAFGPRVPRIGPSADSFHEFGKGIPPLQTLSGSPCFEANFSKVAISRPQQSPENRDPTEPRLGGHVQPALTLRGHFSRVSFGPSFHRRIEPSSDPNVVHLLASRSFVPAVVESSRVWNLKSSGFCSSVVFPHPSLCSLLPVRPSL